MLTGLPQLLQGEAPLPMCGEKCQPWPSQYQQVVDDGVHTPLAGLNLTAGQKSNNLNAGRPVHNCRVSEPGKHRKRQCLKQAC